MVNNQPTICSLGSKKGYHLWQFVEKMRFLTMEFCGYSPGIKHGYGLVNIQKAMENHHL